MGATTTILGKEINALNASTASLAPLYLPLTGGTITGNLTVIGTSSISYISQSTLNIATNTITVNTLNPTVRFGGLSVIDSGSSPQRSGSILYDSLNDQWIFVHQRVPDGIVTSSVFLQGPQTYNNIGNETNLTNNRVLKSVNAEHIGDSNISDTGTVVSINSNTQVTGSVIATSFTGSLLGTASIATIATSASTVLTTTNATHYVTFVPDNNSGGPAAEAFGTVGNLTYNPSIGSLNATSITGSLRGTASYAAVASQSGYTIQMVLATTGSNLAASTTYRMGAPVRNQLITTGGINRIYVPRPGKVRYVNVFVRTNGTLASAGTSTFQLNRQNATLEVIGTSTSVGSAASVSVESTAMSMSVALGEYLDIGFTTPAWATLPTAVECNAIIYIENNI